MNTIIHKLGWGIAGALAVALVAALAGVIYAGPLDPPAGVTTSTPTQEMLIFQPSGACPAGFPITLSAPGAYRLAQNITGCPATDGINITVAGVTLDLDGFSVAGVAGSSNGIRVLPGASDATIRSGTVSGWGGQGVLIQERGALITDVDVSSNALSGIVVMTSGTARISRCATNGNAYTGLSVSGGAHAIVDGCESAFNVKVGFYTAGGTIVLSNSDAHDNGMSGIFLSSGSGGSTIINNTAKSNGENGIAVLDVGSTVTTNTVTNNANSGIDVQGDGATVDGNTVTKNAWEGIFSAGNRDRIINNHVSGNRTSTSVSACADISITGPGSGTVVEGNSAQTAAGCGVPYGVFSFDAPGIIAHGNVARDAAGGSGYQVTANCVGCDIGPIGTASTAVSPWANIEN